jgi:hypothetical protein
VLSQLTHQISGSASSKLFLQTPHALTPHQSHSEMPMHQLPCYTLATQKPARPVSTCRLLTPFLTLTLLTSASSLPAALWACPAGSSGCMHQRSYVRPEVHPAAC